MTRRTRPWVQHIPRNNRRVSVCRAELTDKDFKLWLDEFIKQCVEQRVDPMKHSSQVAQCLLSPETYKQLADILQLDQTLTETVYNKNIDKKLIKDMLLTTRNVKQIDVLRERDLLDEQVEDIVHSDLVVNVTQSAAEDSSARRVSKKDNPYLRYINKLNSSAEEEKLKHSLGRRSGEITKDIIKDFIEWYKALGGESGKSSIDEVTLQELFQVGFELPAAKSVSVRLKQLPTIPQTLATLKDDNNLAIRSGLRKYLIDDALCERKTEKTIGFNKTLPRRNPEMWFKPPKNNTERWLKSEGMQDKLNTMEEAFEGIENLRSTVAYVNWLKGHPEIPPPKFLRLRGVTDIDYKQLMEFNVDFIGMKASSSKRSSILQGKVILPKLNTITKQQDNEIKRFVRVCKQLQ